MRLSLFALLLLAGCGNAVQTTSGDAYRAARPAPDAREGTAMDRAVDRAARVEPLLRFPARFGLARIRYGRLAPVPPREADAWIAFARDHGEYGSFVPVSPLIAELTAADAKDTAKTVVDEIRLGAARQHLDAVLVYTTSDETRDDGTALSVLDLTLLGAFLVPSRTIEGEAVASALLFDVRNGYPYGTASAAARRSGFVPSVGSGGRSRALGEDARLAAVGNLVAEVETMMGRLKAELQDRELAASRAEQAARPTPARPRDRVRPTAPIPQRLRL